ncbi:MAG: hypothetical protein JWQ30_1332 [Sediminibacterium sp.]|nr:hypothetical protein [Sediminibacterium sp.]
MDEPRPQVWQKIQLASQAEKKRPVIVMITRWAVAACILALAGIGAWYVFSEKKTVQVETVSTDKKPTVTPDPVKKDPVVIEKNDAVVNAKTTAHINHKPAARSTQPPVNSQETLTNLRNLENSFTQVINLQRDRVSSMPMYAESPEYFADFKIQIRQMEKDEKVIKSDIAKRGMNDQLLDQLINLYQQKLNTLKQLQTEMNKTNNRYKQSRGPVDSTKTYFLNL